MDVSRQTQSNNSHHHMGKAASELLKESKKMANEVYQQGVDTMCHVQDSIKEYKTEVANQVHSKPLLSLLSAAAIGFILSTLLRK